MRRGSVKSQLLKSIGYDEKKKVLEVEYAADRTVFQYAAVPFSVFRKLATMNNPGSW